MTTLTRALALLALPVVVAACGAKAEPEPPPANDAQRAARIANAIEAAPTKTDSILAAHGLTADQLEQLMYGVAADTALSAEFRRLTGR
jgi:membrane-bound lytic murein transglycosylase B